MSITQPITSSIEQASSIDPILSWSDLNYDVKTKDGIRRVLSDISGSIYPGELVAIMGSSGAGKTTLLNVLAGRVQDGRLYGDIKFNGAKRVPHDFKRMLAYVEQEDMMHAALTVQETLTVSARLRLASEKYTNSEKRQRVDDVMRQLRLSNVAGTRIGGPGMRGVSGGERKRVSIGIELVTDPSILVLDEPSSGLDSSSAEMVVKLTKDMCHERNLCTLMTIHQPSAEIVAQFDKLILLSQGKLVYMGPADQALRYFEQLGYPSTNPNPANFYIDLMTIDFSSSAAMSESETRVQSLVDSFAEFRRSGSRLLPSKASAPAIALADAKPAAAGDSENSTSCSEPNISGACLSFSSSTSEKDGKYNGPHANVITDITHETASLALYEAPPTNSWMSEALILLQRDWVISIRNKSLVRGFLGQSVVMAVFVGFVFFQLKTDQASIQNRIGALFMLVVQCTFPVAIPTMTMIMSGRNVLLRERSAGTYRMSSYFFARALSFYPLVYLPLYVMYAAVYFIAHLQYDAAKFFIGLAILSTVIFASLGYGFAIAMLVRSLEVAHIITPVSLATLMLFAGNLSNANAITPVLRWIKYICLFYYSYSGFMQNEFGGLTFECESTSTACYRTGEDVVATYGLDIMPIWLDVILNIVIGIGLYAIAYGALRWVAKPRYLWL
ncbi:hypothetical protein IW140_002773 [Coemansia sp. RSA 1813]|nr:hypothetical protein EV178_003653 [Coemansia sp. RSA 1646]KAJ1770254.1 hypothetical protein LPJ74_003315 [Coemansia sp. RSA 1843]KAJ2087515.1 hypothetical protein IW138_004885 [Coemansia sp. RSA 986]KAJ2213804.1 hypothetical protein EV179_003503 [Coemansia sp. RSA 487]KAJ2569885.1 hypothetical protein IW140_002773 [Coemansia sp. RSA 1813]